MRSIGLICYLVIAVTNVLSQTPLNKDSLTRLLQQAGEDSNRVQLYIELGQAYENNTPDTAARYYQLAGQLSRKINYPRGIIKYITNYSYLLNMKGDYDSSLLLNLQSVKISREIKDSLYLAKTLFNTGTSYRLLTQFEKAVACYEEGKELFRRFGNESIEAQADDILQVLYSDLHQYDKAIAYGKRSVMLLRKMNDEYMLGPALNNLGMAYTAVRDFSKANELFTELLSISKKTGDKNLETNAYLNIGNTLIQQERYKEIKPYMDQALSLATELKQDESRLIALKGLSFYYTHTYNYPLAQSYATQALQIANEHNFRVQRGKVLTQLSNIAYAMQKPELGEKYATMSTALNDSLLNESIQKNTVEIEKKYETAAKEATIKQLESEKKVQYLDIKRKNTLNYILLFSAIGILAFSMLSYLSYRQQKKLQQQRISELETEKKLAATEAVLKGEEQERSRLAKELHDGLGGMLSGIKYSFQSVKGNVVMTEENAGLFERSIDMLDSSIREMRRVAHNLMPEALMKFGLDAALRDFCNDINKSGALQVSYQAINLKPEALNQTVSIGIYRIVQELLNNVMKHAAASSALVQISEAEGRVSITVEDDGKGFDPAMLDTAKGIGWNNIRSRVDFLKGKLDVHSQPGSGTSVLVEFVIV